MDPRGAEYDRRIYRIMYPLGVYPCVATELTYYHTLNFLLMVFKLSSFFKGKREMDEQSQIC
jgi:hypothetical protein